MQPARMLGHLLLWCGFFAGAFTAVGRPENVDAKWASIHWPTYGLAMAIGIVGVVLLRSTKRTSAQTAESGESRWRTIVTSSRILTEQMTVLHDSEQTINVYDVRHFIDLHLATPLADFANARQTIADRHGLTNYARLMTEFASGERAINRAWAASADGYIDEVGLSLAIARDRFDTLRVYVDGLSDVDR